MNPGGTGIPRLTLQLDPEGTYCCHLSPRELREATIEYRIREEGNIVGATDEADRERYIQTLYSSPSIYPTLTPEESDEDRTFLDTDDYWTLEAHRRYTSLMKRAAQIKIKYKGEEQVKRLTTLREEWLVVKEETELAWEDVSKVAELKGRDGQRILNREAYEVRYCHRDPSDWQILSLTPDHILDLLAHKRRIAEMLDLDYTSEDAEADRREMLCRYRRTQIAQLWQRYFSDELPEDRMKGRIITHWLMRKDNRLEPIPTKATSYCKREGWKFVKPAARISFTEFVDRKIQNAGDELEGLNTALASMRKRVERKRERDERKVA